MPNVCPDPAKAAWFLRLTSLFVLMSMAGSGANIANIFKVSSIKFRKMLKSHAQKRKFFPKIMEKQCVKRLKDEQFISQPHCGAQAMNCETLGDRIRAC